MIMRDQTAGTIPGLLRGTFRRFAAQRFAITSLTVCLLFFFTAVGAECYSIYCSANKTDPVYRIPHVELRNQPPSLQHPLGTDYLGRDVLLRAIFASRTAVKVGIFASLLSAFLGVILGICAGYTYMLNSHLNIEFGVGLWTGLDIYRHYSCPSCGMTVSTGKKIFVAPDDIMISIAYVF